VFFSNVLRARSLRRQLQGPRASSPGWPLRLWHFLARMPVCRPAEGADGGTGPISSWYCFRQGGPIL
jgi:hypothetical protein